MGWTGDDSKAEALEQLLAQWEPFLGKIYGKVRDSLVASGALDMKKLRAETEAIVQDSIADLRQYVRHVRWITAQKELDPVAELLQKQMLTSCSGKITRGITLLIAMEVPKAFAEVSEAVEENFSLEEGCPLAKMPNKLVHSNLPPASQQSLTKVNDANSKLKNPEEFLAAIEELSGSGDVPMPIHRQSKKAEREGHDVLVNKWMAALRNVPLDSDADAVALAGKAFELIVGLALVKQHNVIFPVQGKAIAPIVSTLKEHPSQAKIAQCQGHVVQMIKGSTATEGQLRDLADLRDEILAQL